METDDHDTAPATRSELHPGPTGHGVRRRAQSNHALAIGVVVLGLLLLGLTAMLLTGLLAGGEPS